ncbi:MAG TPA: energy-coupling factor transporter transmembrane component T [Kiritimatiellia bacterium]|nr:energy-coupling factor transporter transmembrane component T [Kiritimatiellia bacterium]HMO99081.1 energy-coupling factor transporter transmembrane component T [Kiritimatiellia bacterium]
MRPVDWLAPYEARSWIHRLDPRARLIAALVLAGAVISVDDPASLLTGVGMALGLLIMARFTWRHLWIRLSTLAGLVVMLALFLPMRFHLVPEPALTYAPELLPEALRIAARASAAAMLMMALVGTIEPTALGHALIHLRVPGKIVQLYSFAIRYFDMLRRELQTLHTAMLARGFRPSASRRALIGYGHLIGGLMVRSLDRSERTLRAMKCRGYRGEFYLFEHFHYRTPDLVFLGASGVFAVALLGWRPWG